MSKRGVKRLTKPMSQSPQEEVDEYVRSLAKHLEELLPPSPGGQKGIFFLLLSEAGEKPESAKHDTNYVSNCQRQDAIKMLRETADRLERGLTRRPGPDAKNYPSDN